jgi:hypothetical protein
VRLRNRGAVTAGKAINHRGSARRSRNQENPDLLKKESLLSQGKRHLLQRERDLFERERHPLHGEADLFEGDADLLQGQPDLLQEEFDFLQEEPDLLQGEPDLLKRERHCMKTLPSEKNLLFSNLRLAISWRARLPFAAHAP